MVEYDPRVSSSRLVLSSLCHGDQRLRVACRGLVLSSPHSHWSAETSYSHTPWPPDSPPSLAGGCGFVPGSHLAVEIDPIGRWQLLLWVGPRCKMVEHVETGQVRDTIHTLYNIGFKLFVNANYSDRFSSV